MSDVLGIIFASDKDERLNELTLHRTTASVPFGGRYRVIDFALSNFVNSNITKVGIITRSNYSSLMDHIRMGRDWDLNRKNSGIAVFPPYVSNMSRTLFKTKVEALQHIMDYISKSQEEYVIIKNSNVVMNINYEDVLDFHKKTKADITVLTYKTTTKGTEERVIKKKTKNIVKEVVIDVEESNKKKEVSLDIYMMKREFLIKCVNTAYMKGIDDLDKFFLQTPKNKFVVSAYEVKDFVSVIKSIKSYYDANMSLLSPKVREELFYKHGRIFTKVKDSIPTNYGKDAKIVNSLIADGCKINGTVENSIIFRGVEIKKGAIVKDSIIMEHGKVGENSKAICAITDKDVTIKDNRVISGHITYPVVIVKGKEV